MSAGASPTAGLTEPPRWPEDIGAGRFASTIRTGSPEDCQVALLGLADDHGVALNGGRVGAAQGPAAFRAALARYGAKEAHAVASDDGWPGVFDAGDVTPGATLDETHARVTEAAGALIDAGLFPVGIGGGHDLTFPFVRAAAQRSADPLSGIYLDAHLDVRAEPGSGMPFRALIERCGVRELTVFGFDPFANTAEHVEWFRANGGVIGETDGQRFLVLLPKSPPYFMSVDLDVLDQSVAPGVSAMNAAGYPLRQVISWCAEAGTLAGLGKLVCFDIMELSPPHDENGRTARVAARLFLSFLRAFRGSRV